MRNAEEFYCTVSGGGCGGYFIVMINRHLGGVVNVICPNCKHVHQRKIRDGKLWDEGRWEDKPADELLGNLGSFSKESRAAKLEKKNERDSVTIESAEERDESFVKERWLELHAGKL